MNFVDHHNWLVESGLLTEEMKNNIAMLSFCLIEDTIDASTNIDFENKTVSYKVIISNDLYKNLKLLEEYKNNDKLGFFDMRRLRSFLVKKRQTDESGLGYELDEIANRFIKAYLNKEWTTTVEYRSLKDYNGKEDLWLHGTNNQPLN